MKEYWNLHQFKYHPLRLAWMCHKIVKKFPQYSRNFYALLFSIQCSGHYPRASFQPTLALDFYAASSSNLCGPPTWQLYDDGVITTGVACSSCCTWYNCIIVHSPKLNVMNWEWNPKPPIKMLLFMKTLGHSAWVTGVDICDFHTYIITVTEQRSYPSKS